MENNYTHITVILDRSGSMASIRDDIIGGFNIFLNDQKAELGKATLTLIQFDTQDSYEVIHQFQPLASVPDLNHNTYVPRANTPLLDAMGRGIIDLEQKLAEMEESEKPLNIVMVIITDGRENSSREFQKAQITNMIKDKQEKANWQFVFLSADLDAIDDALASGIHHSATLAFDRTDRGARKSMRSVSARVSDLRARRRQKVSFTREDREQQQSERRRNTRDKNGK